MSELDNTPLSAPSPLLMALEWRAVFEWSSLLMSWRVRRANAARSGSVSSALPAAAASVLTDQSGNSRAKDAARPGASTA